MKKRPFSMIPAAALAILGGCAGVEPTTPPAVVSDPVPAPEITLGNGERNYIVLDGARRRGATFTFPKVAIDQPGWLVMHPFRDGKPVQTEYVGAQLLAKGVTAPASITINTVPATGERFIVMLHYDKNDDGVFDFNDGITVPDAPVFEGSTLVALRFTAPPE